jgi:hypothetical protein
MTMRQLFASGFGTMLLASLAAGALGSSTADVRKTSGPVLALAADGGRAAFIVEGRVKECWSVMVWEPASRRLDRLQDARTCEATDRDPLRGTPTVALAGTRAAWLELTGTHNLYTTVKTATLARPRPVSLAQGNASDGAAGTFAHRPFGDGALLAFTSEERCHPDYELYACPPGRKPLDVVQATIWRITGGRGPCRLKPRACSPLAKAESELTALAVDAGRIAVGSESGIRLLTSGGRVLKDFPVRAVAAALSGNRLAVRVARAIEVYDTRTGERAARISVANGVRLEDLDGDILVTASADKITLRRLGDGRTSTLRAGRTALAALERQGLFVAGARRVTFTPMRDVLRRFGR